MRRSIAAALVTALAIVIVPAAGSAASACRVLGDSAGDVAGPLGTPRPTQTAGGAVDITSVAMASFGGHLAVDVVVRNLSQPSLPSAGGTFYTTFWSIGSNRYFAQASRVSGTFTYSAGPATGVDDAIPQQGTPVEGAYVPSRNLVRVFVPRSLAGSPAPATLLQQIRAGAQESSWQLDQTDRLAEAERITTNADRAGGPEGGRYLVDRACLPSLSGAGERCLIAQDSPRDARGGLVRDTDIGDVVEQERARSTAVSAVDPATEIVSFQMGSNDGTLLAEIGVASLDRQIPEGAEGERWEVSWVGGARIVTAIAERHSAGARFAYRVGSGETHPTTGSLDASGGTIRILIPRYEVRADGIARMTTVTARSYLLVGVQADLRDTAPDRESFATQFVAGATCADQEKAACPVVLDPVGDAGTMSDKGLPENQNASDISAAGIAAPSGSLIVSMKLQDIGAPPPNGFQEQGWTFSWTHEGLRFFAQAERTRERVIYRYGLLGAAKDFQAPSGPQLFGGNATEGMFDLQAGVLRISVPRDGVGSPGNGALLTDVGAQSWILRDNSVAGTEASPYVPVDNTPIAPYRVGIACGA